MKKSLSAKEYLSQLAILNEQINQDLDRLRELKQCAANTGSFDYSQEKIQTSPVGDKLCSDVSRYVDAEKCINDEIDRFVDAKEQIIKEIRELHDVNYIQVLYKVYVQFKTLKTAATEMGKSYTYAKDTHKKALKMFGHIHKNLTYWP